MMHRGTTRGFTLIELLVATSITAVLAGLLIAVTSGLLGAWERSRGRVASDNQAKLALDLLSRDLQGLIIRADGQVWMAATVQPDQGTQSGDSGAGIARWMPTTGGTTKPGEGVPGTANSSLHLTPASERLEDYRFGMAGVWLRFFTTEPDSNDGDLKNTSAPRAVAYQMLRYVTGTKPDAAIRYGLFRSWVRPHDASSGSPADSVFTVGYDLFTSGTGAAHYNNPEFSGNSSPGDAGTIRRPNASLLLSGDVVDFGVRVWVRDPYSGELSLAFPAVAGLPSSANRGFAATTAAGATPVNPYLDATQMSYGFPAVIEVFLRVLTQEGANELEAFERGRIVGRTWWDIVLANSRVYTRRVEIIGRAL